MSYCTNCGKPVSEDDQFCSYCGVRLMDEPVISEELKQKVRKASARAHWRAGRPRRILLMTVVCVVVFAVCFFAGGLLSGSKQEEYTEVVEKFMKAYSAGDAEAAGRYCIEPCRDEVVSQINAVAAVMSFYGDGARMTCDIAEAERCNAEFIKKMQKELKREYGYKDDVSEVWLVKTKIKVKTDDNTETISEQMLALKVDDTWYIWYR